MLDFDFCNPTRIVFGKGRHKEISSLIKVHNATKVLLHYGGGSIKRSSLYEDVCVSLKESGLLCVELGGVQANPTYELVQQGIRLCRDEKVDWILAVGGGSVLDSAKSIAMGALDQGDVWDFFTCKRVPESILPVATILTLPASGSEQSPDAVLTRDGRKICAIYPGLRPFVSVINPELFYSIPPDQIANGICDMMCHVMERYFSKMLHTEFMNGLCESTLRTLLNNAKAILRDPSDYDAWAEAALAGSFGHNGLMGLGRVEDWACHAMEHQLSAANDTVPHGAGLAVLYPAWMQYVYTQHKEIFLSFATKVMAVEEERFADADAAILEGIRRLREFFCFLGLPSTMGELGMDGEDFQSMAQKATGFDVKNEKPIGNVKQLYWQDVLNIYQSVL